MSGKPREGRDRPFAKPRGRPFPNRRRPSRLRPGSPEPVSDTPCGPARSARAGAASDAGRRQSCPAGHEPIRPSLAPDPPVQLPPPPPPTASPANAGRRLRARARTGGGGPLRFPGARGLCTVAEIKAAPCAGARAAARAPTIAAGGRRPAHGPKKADVEGHRFFLSREGGAVVAR